MGASNSMRVPELVRGGLGSFGRLYKTWSWYIYLWKRALGVTKAKRRVSKKTGIPKYE